MRKALIVLVAMLSVGCSGGGGGSKNLFSTWESEYDGTIVDFSEGQFGITELTFVLPGPLGGCTCSMELTGTQENGFGNITACSGTVDCSLFEFPFVYTKSAKKLNICVDSECESFK